MRKRKKRTSGSRPTRLLLTLAVLAAGTAAVAGKSKKSEPFAVIAGSVFRENGFSLVGAELSVDVVPGPDAPPKFKRIKAVTDARGEFAVRVPAVPLRYTVSIKASGYKLASKEVHIQGEERVELFFRLEPESK